MTGPIQNRDHFLNKIAKNLGRETRRNEVLRPVYQFQPQLEVLKDATKDELVLILKEMCTRINTDFFETSLDELPQTLEEVIESFGGGPILIPKDERFSEYQLDDLLKGKIVSDGHVVNEWNASKGDENIIIAEQANIGITFSEITLAESGTVVLYTTTDIGRSISLLPTTYIAIIPKSSIVPRMTQAAIMIRESVQRGEIVPSSINFVSGPSNSADIEMNLVVGVHGPVKAAYIVVDDK